MMRKNVLTMTLLAGLLLVSSCASKKDLEDCRQNNLKLLESSKEVFMNYQQTKEQLAAANARVASLEEQLAQSKDDYKSLQRSLDKSLVNTNQTNVSIEKLVDQIKRATSTSATSPTSRPRATRSTWR